MRRDLRDSISVLWHNALEVGRHWHANGSSARDWKRMMSLAQYFELRLGNRKIEFDDTRSEDIGVRNVKYGSLYLCVMMLGTLGFRANYCFNSRLYYTDVL
eukprot:TRINITY_DN3643_c0_g2_i3.p1 TRINITY_DN3643_c0_g2~~TRINITY_DN3643_c0_g2_i3.p1  ORF type:complete len:101 (+),score=3.09 TRINITY_DN3643_c0_g2_i3:2-304(+)